MGINLWPRFRCMRATLYIRYFDQCSSCLFTLAFTFLLRFVDRWSVHQFTLHRSFLAWIYADPFSGPDRWYYTFAPIGIEHIDICFAYGHCFLLSFLTSPSHGDSLWQTLKLCSWPLTLWVIDELPFLSQTLTMYIIVLALFISFTRCLTWAANTYCHTWVHDTNVSIRLIQ